VPAFMVGKPGAQPRVSARITLEEHHGHFALGQSVQAVADQRRARPLALSRGLHGDGTEYLHVDEPSGSIEHAPGEQHVPDDLTGILGDETEPVDQCHRLAQFIDEVGHQTAVVRKRGEVQTPHGSVAFGLLETKVHAGRVGRTDHRSSRGV